MKKNFFKALCGVMILTGALSASDKHISVGEREMSYRERVAFKEEREKLESENQEEDGKKAKSIYYTSHNGAYHHPLAVSLLGDTVELEDGSIWAVCSSDRWKTLDWMTGDVILVVPNHSWLSIYDYRLINANTGAKVKVNLSLGPIYNGIHTHWILAIDYLSNEIVLEDGSVWTMSGWDARVVEKWLLNDTIIIGVNDGWLSGYNPNILINVTTNNYAIGDCIY